MPEEPVEPDEFPPPQPIVAAIAKTANSARIDIQRRRRAEIPHVNTRASTAPAPSIFPQFPSDDLRRDAVNDPVVYTAITIVPCLLVGSVTMLTLFGVSSHVGRLWAPVGEPVRAQVTLIKP